MLSFLSEHEEALVIVPIGFLITDARLTTVHWAPIQAIQACRQRLATSEKPKPNPWAIFIALFETHIDTLADDVESL